MLADVGATYHQTHVALLRASAPYCCRLSTAKAPLSLMNSTYSCRNPDISERCAKGRRGLIQWLGRAPHGAPQTTIMAASFPGGVVLGADSRTSTGSYVANRVTNKLTQLAEKVLLPSDASSMLPQACAAKQGPAATTRPGVVRNIFCRQISWYDAWRCMLAIRSSLPDRVSMNVLGLAAMLGLHVGLLSGGASPGRAGVRVPVRVSGGHAGDLVLRGAVHLAAPDGAGGPSGCADRGQPEHAAPVQQQGASSAGILRCIASKF